jgi:hypothetical protein
MHPQELSTCLSAGVFLLALGACEGAVPVGTDVSLHVADTILGQSDTVLAQPAAVTVDEQGRIYLTDWSNSRLAVLDANGTFLRVIGREGAGPGEFRSPAAVLAREGRIRVVDSRNGRQQILGDTGAFIASTPLPPGAMSGSVSLRRDGGMLVSVNGADSVLARRYGPDGTLEAELGRPVAPGADVWNFADIKKEIGEGRVPGMLRNLTIPVLAPDGSAWLGLMAEGTVERYSPDGSLLWQVTLAEPEFDTILAEFFEANNREPNPARLHSLSYFSAGIPVGQEFWLLVRRREKPALILVLGPDGTVMRRIRIPVALGINDFALDVPRRRLYLLAFADATLLRVEVPADLLPHEMQ